MLGWKGIPNGDAEAHLVLGQTDANSADENRGGAIGGDTFRWPHAIAGDENGLWIADAGNHRVLGWRGHPEADCPSDFVLGQESMSEAREWPYDIQGAHRLRFPYGMASQKGMLAVADTANNRILFWKLPLLEDAFAAAKEVIGQIDFASFGENHWKAVEDNSLCWPYGISMCDRMVAIADSGNNRVMLWDCSEIVSSLREPLEAAGS